MPLRGLDNAGFNRLSYVDSMLGNLSKREILIPLNIFSSKLGILEALTKYLYEEKGMTFKEISELIGKDNKSLWASYNNSKKKKRSPFRIERNSPQVPLDYFAKEGLSVFECIILNLHEIHKVNFRDLAKTFNRSYQNIWTTYKRAKEKSEK